MCCVRLLLSILYIHSIIVLLGFFLWNQVHGEIAWD